MNTNYIKYLLHLADNALILGHRNSEWCGHGPVLEQDIAISNIALDLLGQARNFYQYTATVLNGLAFDAKKDLFTSKLLQEKIVENATITEDDFAYLRDQEDYRNYNLLELPKGNWAVTILRQYIYASYSYHLFSEIANINFDKELTGIVLKSLKEIKYHITWSKEWILRLGDGTEESHEKMQEALNALYPYTADLFNVATFENNLPIATITKAFYVAWQQEFEAILSEATLQLPTKSLSILGNGKEGLHTEHLSYLLAELQVVHRAHPNSVW